MVAASLAMWRWTMAESLLPLTTWRRGGLETRGGKLATRGGASAALPSGLVSSAPGAVAAASWALLWAAPVSGAATTGARGAAAVLSIVKPQPRRRWMSPRAVFIVTRPRSWKRVWRFATEASRSLRNCAGGRAGLEAAADRTMMTPRQKAAL
jgi:hypothetical protein